LIQASCYSLRQPTTGRYRTQISGKQLPLFASSELIELSLTFSWQYGEETNAEVNRFRVSKIKRKHEIIALKSVFNGELIPSIQQNAIAVPLKTCIRLQKCVLRA